jgi:hypothetical protein
MTHGIVFPKILTWIQIFKKKTATIVSHLTFVTQNKFMPKFTETPHWFLTTIQQILTTPLDTPTRPPSTVRAIRRGSDSQYAPASNTW